MSISIDDFSDPAFDVKAWVNRAAAGYVDERPRAFDSALVSPSRPSNADRSPPLPPPTRRCPSQDPERVEKHLAEVEMKLQLMAEDISMALEEQSVSGLRRIPRAVAEIDRVEHDTKSLQSRIRGILRRLDDAEGASRDAVRALASVDKVKARMEHARETLANAAGLAELVASADAVAATGDVRHIADVLASMRRGLRVVGDVPEFADAPSRAEALEKRVETLARPELVSALAAGDAARAEEMRDVLHVSGKIQTVFSAYAETRVVEPLLREWKAFSSGKASTDASHDKEVEKFAAWVPGYAAAVADAVRREVAWTSRVLPKESDELVVAAWRELSALTKREFAQRAATRSLDRFAETYARAARGFGDAARALLVTETGEKTGVAPAAALGALAEALAPFEGVRARYAELEERALSEDGALAAALAEADEAARRGDAEATAAAAAAATAGLAAAAAAATARCEKLADGLETRAMLRALDAATAARVRGVCVALRRLRLAKGMAVPPAADKEEGAAAPAAPAAPAETRKRADRPDGSVSVEADVRAAVSLLAASAATTSRVETLTARVKAWLERAFASTPKSALRKALPATASSDPPAPRDADGVAAAAAAAAADADKARALRAFFADASAMSDPLPGARAKARAFADATRAFALETLASRALRELAGYKISTKRDAAPDAGGDLPAFSAYPQEAVTGAGEYLLSLPQTLEQVAEAREADRAAARDAAASAAAEALGSPRKPASVGAEEAEGSRAAASEGSAFGPEMDPGEWMADVARLASDALVAEIRGVAQNSLSEAGAAQLAADAEYFANVVAALAPEPPRTLAAFAACCATPRDAYAGFAASEDGKEHGEVIGAVAKMRGIAL